MEKGVEFDSYETVRKLAEATGLEIDDIDLLSFDKDGIFEPDPFVLSEAVEKGLLIKNKNSDLLGDKIEELLIYIKLHQNLCLYPKREPVRLLKLEIRQLWLLTRKFRSRK